MSGERKDERGDEEGERGRTDEKEEGKKMQKGGKVNVTHLPTTITSKLE
jgi:hypothetical protein